MKRHIPILLGATALLGACTTLPSSGPTGREVLRTSAEDTQLGLSVVEVDSMAAIPLVQADEKGSLPDRQPPPTDMVGLGDVLNISIYEAGVSLFAATPAGISAAATGGDTGAKAHMLPEMRVDDNGDIFVPYAGKLRVMGKTVSEIEAQIRHALRGFSQNPQVIVTRHLVISNAVIVGGEIAHPGRLVLQTNRETFSDVIALAGGYRGKAADMLLRVDRGNEHMDVRLSTLLDNSELDRSAYPGDRLTLISAPHSLSVLGAAGKMEQLSFPKASVSLSEAIAMAGGPNPNMGDPKAIFVFRYVDDGNGDRKPVVYHINMMKTASYFLAQNFRMQDKDIVYFGNAQANQPSKMIQLISQLFTPISTVVTAAAVTGL